MRLFPNLPRPLLSTAARWLLFSGALAFAGGAPMARCQDASPVMTDNVSLKQLMTPEEYKAAGLKKLSPEEIQRLENFLKGYREQAVQQVAKATEERVDPPPKRDRATHQSVVESRITGHFPGLTGRTRVVLSDGSIWQELNDVKFSVALDNPQAVLVKTAFGYKMYVMGAPDWFYVRQIVVN